MTVALDAARRFVENAVIIFRALFAWFQLHAYLATKVVMPVEQLVFFSLLGLFAGGPSRIAYMAIGNAVVLMGLSGIGAATTIGEERVQGTLALLLASPANRLLNFLQRGVLHVADGLLTVALALGCAVLLFHVDLSRTDWPGLVASVLVAAFSSIGLGLLLGALTLGFSELHITTNVLYFALLVVAGVNFPPQELPAWLQPVSQVVPFTRSIAGARGAIAGAPLAAIAPLLRMELLIGLLYTIAGYLVLRGFEMRAVRTGRLELV
jgi:ABC-2 type transport system permease protein